uniref:Uncharacterized protein n=1 Tax=Nelumbo nucifera TaxID=4432 RepID=A0A822XUJ0_NELNU|nr:TPA_asm: hypothetical protein HUJ06_022571 [Nelumbo nucifera]
MQRQFIEDLGVPSAWLHEARATYYHYYGNMSKALEYSNWQRAHLIFTTSVVHTLFLSANHPELWRLAHTMEEYKSEIADWDLGAEIYVSFYSLKDALREENSTSELDCLDS